MLVHRRITPGITEDSVVTVVFFFSCEQESDAVISNSFPAFYVTVWINSLITLTGFSVQQGPGGSELIMQHYWSGEFISLVSLLFSLDREVFTRVRECH